MGFINTAAASNGGKQNGDVVENGTDEQSRKVGVSEGKIGEF